MGSISDTAMTRKKNLAQILTLSILAILAMAFMFLGEFGFDDLLSDSGGIQHNDATADFFDEAHTNNIGNISRQLRSNNNNAPGMRIQNQAAIKVHERRRRQAGDESEHQRKLFANNQFLDPKSIAMRMDEQQQTTFSYGFSSDSKNCINPQEVEEIGRTLRDLYEKHGVRAFPRNGFLLGIARHGGFLPNEDAPDADLGIISTDVDRYRDLFASSKKTSTIPTFLHVGQFILSQKPTETYWVNWKGIEPVTGTQYPFFGVRIKRQDFSIRAQSMYPYPHSPNTFFYPRLNLADYNHKSHTKEMLRYNTEGANYRLLDTDELLTEDNNLDGLSIGTVFQDTFDCMMLKQFYFTMIYVPCDYEAMLEAFYGKKWNHVESRAKGGKGSQPAVKLSEAEHLHILESGPKPLCA